MQGRSNKVLIIRLSSIGDIVLTSPVIRCLKRQKNFEIHFLTKPAYSEILSNNPYIDKIHYLQKSLLKTGLTLAHEKFDYVIDLHKNLRTNILKLLIQAKINIAFDKINIEKWIAVNTKKLNVLPAKHLVDRYFESLNKIQITNDGEGLDYFISDKDFEDAKKILNLPEHYVAWAIGAQHFTKKFPPDKIAMATSQLQFPVVLLGDKHDESTAADVLAKTTNQQIINACNKLTINQSAAVVKHAAVVVTNDTGLMHIAAAFKKPIVSIWGNTIPQFGMYPYFGNYKVRHQIIENPNLYCRPCSKIGFKQCPEKHFKCMNDIDVNVLVNYVNNFAQNQSL